MREGHKPGVNRGTCDGSLSLYVFTSTFYGYAKQRMAVEMTTFYSCRNGFEEQWWTRKRDVHAKAAG